MNFNWLKVFRVKEVLPGICPILIASLDTQKILPINILIPLVIGFISIYFSAFLINELVDSFDTDKYNSEREKGITKHGISTKFTLAAFFVTSILGIGIMYLLNLTWIGLVGFLILFGYSAPKIRLKSRPFLELFVVTVGFVFLSYLSYYFLVGQLITWKEIIVLLFFISGFTSIQLINEGADYWADKQAGISTTAVFLGEKNNLILVSILSITSTILGILAVILTGHWWYLYIVFSVFFLFTAVQFGLTIYRDQDRLHELLRTGEKFGVFISDLGTGILLLIWTGWILKNWLL